MLQNLLRQLHHPEAHLRRETACVLGLVEESEALGALGAQFKAETDDEVKSALQWAGKRIQTAKQNGHTTLEALIVHFHIDREITGVREQATDNEKMMVEKMQRDLEMEMLARKVTDRRNSVLGTAFSGVMMGLPGMMMAASASGPVSTDVMSSNLGEHPRPQPQRTPATQPSTIDIRLQVRKLLEDRDPEKRYRAAIDLGSVSHNPEALPYLAQAFMSDSAIKVREAAERSGKHLYWNTIYWQMEQDGSLAAEIKRRREVLHGPERSAPPQATTTSTAQPAPQQSTADIADILRKAEQARQKRKR